MDRVNYIHSYNTLRRFFHLLPPKIWDSCPFAFLFPMYTCVYSFTCMYASVFENFVLTMLKCGMNKQKTFRFKQRNISFREKRKASDSSIRLVLFSKRSWNMTTNYLYLFTICRWLLDDFTIVTIVKSYYRVPRNLSDLSNVVSVKIIRGNDSICNQNWDTNNVVKLIAIVSYIIRFDTSATLVTLCRVIILAPRLSRDKTVYDLLALLVVRE